MGMRSVPESAASEPQQFALATVIEPAEPQSSRGVQRLAILFARERAIDLRILTGTPTRPVLIHQVKIGLARHLVGKEREHLVGSRDTAGQHEVAHE